MSERVVLLAVDGLDWRRLRAGAAAGHLPHFQRLLAESAYAEVPVLSCVPGLGGADMAMNSPTLWTTIATGQYYFQHGVYDFCNAMEAIENPPLFESRHVRSPRIWDVLSQHQIPSLVLGYYVTHPAYRLDGLMVGDLFGEIDSRNVVWPPSFCDEAARLLGARDYAQYREMSGRIGGESRVRGARAEEPVDENLRAIAAKILREFTALTPAEIAALWEDPAQRRARQLLEYRLIYPYVRDERLQRLFLELHARQPWRFAAVYYRLIDFVGHGFWTEGLRLDAEFTRRYGPVVDRAYAWIDRCVGEICKVLDARDRLIVMSDHGFAATATPPEFTAEGDISEFSYGAHAEPAVLLARGGGRKGLLTDISLLDIAPTIWDFFGIPQAETLDGGPVPGLLSPDAPRNLPKTAAYSYAPPVETGGLSEREQAAVLERLAALGYVE